MRKKPYSQKSPQKKRHKKAKLFFYHTKKNTQKLKSWWFLQTVIRTTGRALFTPPCGETPCVAMAVFRIQPPPTGTLSLSREVATMLRVILREFPLPKIGHEIWVGNIMTLVNGSLVEKLLRSKQHPTSHHMTEEHTTSKDYIAASTKTNRMPHRSNKTPHILKIPWCRLKYAVLVLCLLFFRIYEGTQVFGWAVFDQKPFRLFNSHLTMHLVKKICTSYRLSKSHFQWHILQQWSMSWVMWCGHCVGRGVTVFDLVWDVGSAFVSCDLWI